MSVDSYSCFVLLFSWLLFYWRHKIKVENKGRYTPFLHMQTQTRFCKCWSEQRHWQRLKNVTQWLAPKVACRQEHREKHVSLVYPSPPKCLRRTFEAWFPWRQALAAGSSVTPVIRCRGFVCQPIAAWFHIVPYFVMSRIAAQGGDEGLPGNWTDAVQETLLFCSSDTHTHTQTHIYTTIGDVHHSL